MKPDNIPPDLQDFTGSLDISSDAASSFYSQDQNELMDAAAEFMIKRQTYLKDKNGGILSKKLELQSIQETDLLYPNASKLLKNWSNATRSILNSGQDS